MRPLPDREADALEDVRGLPVVAVDQIFDTNHGSFILFFFRNINLFPPLVEPSFYPAGDQHQQALPRAESVDTGVSRDLAPLEPLEDDRPVGVPEAIHPIAVNTAPIIGEGGLAPFEGDKKPLVDRGSAFLRKAGSSVSVRRGAVSLELSGKFGEIQAELLDVIPVDIGIDLNSPSPSGRRAFIISLPRPDVHHMHHRFSFLTDRGIPTAAPTATQNNMLPCQTD